MEAEKYEISLNNEARELINSFCRSFRARITIFSSQVDSALSGYPYSRSRLCILTGKNLFEGFSKCDSLNRKMCLACGKHNKLLFYQCHSGLKEAVIPIVTGTIIAGYAMIGQFRNQETPPKDLVEKWCDAGFDEKTLNDAFLETPYYNLSATNDMLNLFSMLIGFIISNKHVKVENAKIINPALSARIVHWIDAHISDTITLERAAAEIGCSISSLTHTVKRDMGISFKQFCILKRIEKFERILLTNPGCTIAEAADMVNYDDALYFSRLYKKIRRKTPREYCRTLRAESGT